MAASIALVQNDLKKILAYSTISQLGLMMVALGAGGYTAGLFHLMTHAFFKALLFLCAGAVIHSTSLQDIRQMGGLWAKMKVTAITCLVACLAISGVPPLSGFWSKDEILLALYNHNKTIYWLAMLVCLMTAFYMFRLLSLLSWASPDTERSISTIPGSNELAVNHPGGLKRGIGVGRLAFDQSLFLTFYLFPSRTYY